MLNLTWLPRHFSNAQGTARSTLLMLGQNLTSLRPQHPLAIYASLLFPNQFQNFLVTWMASEGVQVGVVLDPPTPQLVTGVRK